MHLVSPYNNATMPGRGVAQPKDKIAFNLRRQRRMVLIPNEFFVIEKKKKKNLKIYNAPIPRY